MKVITKKIFLFFLLLAAGYPLFAQTLENAVIDAVTYYNLGKYDKAEPLFRAIAEKDAENDAAQYYLSLIARSKNDAERAELYAKNAVELDGENYWYQSNLADIYARTSRQELAIAIYRDILKKHPDKTELYYTLVELFLSQKQWENALETLDNADIAFGKTEQSTLVRYQILGNMGKTDEAVDALKEYNKEYSSPIILATLGDMAAYNDSTALAYYNEALDLDPNCVAAILGKVEIYRQQRDYEKYFSEFQKVAENVNIPPRVKSEYFNAIVQKTSPTFVQKFKSNLAEVMEIMVRQHPDSGELLQSAGAFCYAVKEFDEAQAYFRKNVDLHPDDPLAWGTYVELLMYTNKLEDLSKVSMEAYAKFPETSHFLESAVFAEFNMKHYDRVLELCDEVIAKYSEDKTATSQAWALKGDVYHTLGNDKKTFKAYDNALKITPDAIHVLNNYAYYLSIAGKKLKKAEAMSKKTIDAEPDNATYLDTYGWILYLQGNPQLAKTHFKHAMLYGGKDSAVILDHYADVLYALKEYDLAFVYWNMALKQKSEDLPALEEKIAAKKAKIKR